MNDTPTPVLLTARLDLLPLTPADAPDMSIALADPELFTFIGGQPASAQELAERYRRYNAGPPDPTHAWHNWAMRLRDDGRAIGHLQATVTENGAHSDIAWMVGTPWQGRGYASEAAAALVGWLEGEGVETITAHVHPGNAGSAGVAARIGLERTTDVEDGEIIWRRRQPGTRLGMVRSSADVLRGGARDA